MRSDTITLSGITAVGYHGVFEHEKRDGQPFTLDVVLHTDIRRAAASDNVADTAHYGELGELVVTQIQDGPWDLIETLAEKTAAAILASFPTVMGVEVIVHKPKAPITVTFSDVTIHIYRERE
ncbi:dihydroneopterin aldolase [Paeniglutamicibacter sp. Y32M11]|uniref:7,8-dihydroneopterin aldolase n=2 Tax=Micrococcaceae TaxID=1268 RepID=A0ABX1G907_9MICC|nr:dihydroneopterin aldolase [Arthrobacter sp. 7749]NKG22743.1 dihydroneopterin aldolase [Paeniglutamicibacter terrestris]QXQ12010.1 dihydroneopterin aldolase [Paeniglutamicibacter sp. Y32M11]